MAEERTALGRAGAGFQIAADAADAFGIEPFGRVSDTDDHGRARR